MWEKYKNISNESYAKLMNWLSKMKELDQFFIQKGLFVSIKGRLCLTKGHLDNPEGQVEVESPLIEVIFNKFHLYYKMIFFQKKGTFCEAFDPRTLYLSKIGPDTY